MMMKGPRNLNNQSTTQTGMGESKSTHTLNGGVYAKKTAFSSAEKNESHQDLQIVDESPIGQEMLTFRDQNQTPNGVGATEMNFEDDQAIVGMITGQRGDDRTLLSDEFQMSGFRVRS